MLYDCINKKELDIKPFMPMYKNMVNITDANKMNITDDNRAMDYNKEFLSGFNDDEKAIVREVLDSNKRIPQEILNYQDYLKEVD